MKILTFTNSLKFNFLLVFLGSFLLNTTFSYSQNNSITSSPKWVKNVNYKLSDSTENGSGYRYLLIDLQDNIFKKTVYRHYAIKVLNAEGIQNMSDLDIEFDPSYQKLSLHAIQIIRDGKIIHKINDSRIQTIQKETNSERSLYDGSLTTIINLNDVRENDIIEYSYSIVGFNPINKGNYGRTFYQKYTIPVNRIYNRLVTNAQNPIKYKFFSDAEKPIILKNNNLIEYIWDTEDEDFELYDNNTPLWFDSQKRISITTFKSWENVVNWALPLYIFNKNEIATIDLNLDKKLTKEERISKIIRFVQDDIRYLGFENGISAYKPHSPKKVYNQRYGDCKDKSLLLVALLRKEGISSYPLLVNTVATSELSKKIPSNFAFNHCVVYLKHKDSTYFIDPTISNQGGNLENISFPNYAYGLLVKPNEKDLIPIPNKNIPSLDISETITIDSIGGNAKLNIISTYNGGKSDYMRSYFNTTSKESIEKEYLNFYSNLYDNIESLETVKIIDDDRDASNTFTVEENYLIEKFWQEADNGSGIYCETYPLVLETISEYTNSAKRSMPYYIGEPHSYYQTTVLNLSEEWPIEDNITTITGEGFKYENIIKGFDKRIEIVHDYKLTKSVTSSEEVDDFFKKHEDIRENFSYFLTYNPDLEGFKLSWISVLILFITSLIGIFFAFKVYKKYNPIPLENNEDLVIGGWIVLPTIGLVLTPFFIIFQLFSEDFFNHNTWLGLINSGLDNSYEILFFIGAELIYNILYLSFVILLIILLFNRRSSFPKLISLFYLLNFIMPLLDIFIVSEILPDSLTETDSMESVKEITRSAIIALIWIPYFNISERVKNTFVKRLNND